MKQIRTQVGIVGGGPAGLMLGHLLHLRGIQSFILEDRSEEHVIERVRAGVLEQSTVDLMHEVGARRPALARRSAARRDLRRVRRRATSNSAGGADRRPRDHDLRAERSGEGSDRRARRDRRAAAVRGRRGQHSGLRVGPAEDSLPSRWTTSRSDLRLHRRLRRIARHLPAIHPGRIGRGSTSACIRSRGWAFWSTPRPARTSSCTAFTTRGFALFSMRSPHVTRLYLQVPPDEDIEQWPDDRIWSELVLRLHTRDGWTPNRGPITQKGITRMRSVVVEPMNHGAAVSGRRRGPHRPADRRERIEPGDGGCLEAGRRRSARSTNQEARDMLHAYSERGLRRTWRAQRFAAWMTSALHRDRKRSSAFDERRQIAELEYLVSSRAAMTSLAENYVGGHARLKADPLMAPPLLQQAQ